MVLKKCSKKFNQILGLMKKEGKLIKKNIGYIEVNKL